MALSIAIAVTNFDTRSMKAVRKRLQVSDYFFRNLPPREIGSPTESEASSGYGSIDTIVSSSTSTDSRRQSLSDSLPDSQVLSQTESESDSKVESQANSQVETLLETLIESILELLPGSRAELRGETRAEAQAETPKVRSEDFPEDYKEYCVKGSRKKDVLEECPPLRLMYGNRDILNLGANIRKPVWPKIPKHNVEEGRKGSGSVYFRLEADDTMALNEDYPVKQCHNCSFGNPSPSLFDQLDTTDDSTDKNVEKPTIFCCGRKMATDLHDFRVICKRNRY